MGYHNVLTGEDLHEPSRLRINNSTVNTLIPGQLVKIDGPVVEGVTLVESIADTSSTLVGFVDTTIGVGEVGSVFMFGRSLNVAITNEDPNDPLVEGDYLRVQREGTTNVNYLVKTISEEGRVATVLSRVQGASIMSILFDPIRAVASDPGAGVDLNGMRMVDRRFELDFTVSDRTESESSRLFFNYFGQDVASTAGADSFNYSETEHSITILQAGLYELTLPNIIYFNLPFAALANNIPGTDTNTTSLTYTIRVNADINNQAVILAQYQSQPISFTETATSPGTSIQFPSVRFMQLTDDELTMGITTTNYPQLFNGTKLLNLGQGTTTDEIYFDLVVAATRSEDSGRIYTLTIDYPTDIEAPDPANSALIPMAGGFLFRRI